MKEEKTEKIMLDIEKRLVAIQDILDNEGLSETIAWKHLYRLLTKAHMEVIRYTLGGWKRSEEVQLIEKYE